MHHVNSSGYQIDVTPSHHMVARRTTARTLITFLYHESRDRQHSADEQKRNLAFFMDQGVEPAMRNSKYHFAIVLSAPCMTPALPSGADPAHLTIHDLNGSQGFELFNFKRFLSTRWCGGSDCSGRGCDRSRLATRTLMFTPPV